MLTGPPPSSPAHWPIYTTDSLSLQEGALSYMALEPLALSSVPTQSHQRSLVCSHWVSEVGGEVRRDKGSTEIVIINAYNPSYSEGDQEDHGYRQVQVKS
jgi:hypothetical protein